MKHSPSCQKVTVKKLYLANVLMKSGACVPACVIIDEGAGGAFKQGVHLNLVFFMYLMQI